MDKKYKLIDETRVRLFGAPLHRIEALRDFGSVKKGDLGGFVEKESNLSHDGDCWVFNDAMIYGNAMIYDNVNVRDNAKVYDNASICGDARVCGNAKVYDNATVYGSAIVCGNAKVYDNATVYGSAIVYDNIEVYGDATVYGSASAINGNAKISNDALITNGGDYATISGFGSEYRTTTFYRTKNGGIQVNCGCFSGTIEEFKERVVKTHHGTKYEKDYLLAAILMEEFFKK